MTELILVSLAAWRLASLLVREDGPGAIFARLRYAAGIRYVVQQGPDGRPMAARTARGWLAEGLTCVWCVSVWTAAGLVGLGLICAALGIGWAYEALRLILAASAGAIIVAEILRFAQNDREAHG